MSDSSSSPTTSSESPSPPSGQSYSWLGSSPLQWFSTIAASVVGFPVAWKLSHLLEDPAVSSTKTAMAALYSVAMYAPMALRGVASVLRAARSGTSGGAEK